MGILYEISSLTAPVMSQPNISSQSLGSLNQGNQIDVLSFSESWANFKYNNNNAYVNISNLKIVGNEVKGSITLKYIDINTNNEIYCSETLNNLELGNHSYDSKTIYGYKLQSDSTQSVNLTADNPNQTVTFYYKQILGSIVIKYIDSITNIDISDSKTIENLTLGTYTYGAINLSSYILNDNEIKAVTITETSPNATITFKYNSLLGNITIKYLDSSTLTEIAPATRISNIALGSYTYDAIYIDKYEVDGDSIISITLTTTEPNKIISFKYNKIEIPYDLNWNEVPYISTYYIKPIVKPGEEVFIDYYITDYYYKEYLKEDYSESFTVTVRVESQDDKLYHNLKAGDHQVSLGSFNNEGEQKFSILCTDKYGRNSHELFNFFLVQGDIEIKEYVMTEEDLKTYNIKNTDNYEVKKIIDLSSLTTKNSSTVKAALVKAASNIIPESKTYVCVIADTNGDGNHDNWWRENQVVYSTDYDKNAVLQEATNTRKGLQKLLDDKKTAGYNKLKLLPGIYRVDHQQQIYIPTEFTLDMNGATFKQNQFTGNKSLMIELNNTFNSHVIDGIIEGDYFSHDYTNSSNNSEWVNGVNIGGEAKYSSFENLTIKDITGYGSSNGIAPFRDGKLGYTYIYPKGIGNNFKIGDIDRSTGLDITSTTRTTSDYIDISGYSDIGYLSVSVYLGYQGNPCGTWNLICHFYDENKNFIKSIDSYQYRRIAVLKNSRYMRVTILNTAYPTNLSIQYFRIPTHCSFNNVKHENCRCVGMAPNAMKDMLMEACEFTNCGQSGAKCAFDAEDGWDMMQDITFKLLIFNKNPYNYFLTCAGHNLIIDGQQNGKVYIWERTRSLIIMNCTNVELILRGGGLGSIVQHGVYRVFNNTLLDSSTNSNLIKNNQCTALTGLAYNCSLTGLRYNSSYTNCTIKVLSTTLGMIQNVKFINCNFVPDDTFTNRYRISFNGGHLDSYYFKDCNFYGKSILDNHVNFYSGKFINCNFEDVQIKPSVNANSDDLIYFENCNINYSTNNLIYYSPAAYSKGTFSQIEFNNCKISNLNAIATTSFIYAYAKPNGYCKFTNCTISLPISSLIFDGYPTNISYIENYTIYFITSQLPHEIKLISNNYSSNTNIKINIT